jgi:hypothetical protein
MKRMYSLVTVLLAVVLTGCASNVVKPDLSAFQAAKPRSILVVPATNKSVDVDAPAYLLTTLTVPLAEKGFYVFPIHTAKTVLEQEGLYEGEQIHNQSPAHLAQMFGADAVLYVTINQWDAKYVVLSTTVTVDFDYRLVSKDGTELWKANKRMQYSPQNQGGGLIGAMISAAVARAAPNYMPLTQIANNDVFIVGPTAIPNGPYRTVQ